MCTETNQATKKQHFIEIFCGSEGAKTLARLFAENMVEGQSEMCEDDPTAAVPTLADLRAATYDYATDMMADFKQMVLDEVQTLFERATIDVRATRSVNINVTF